MSAAAFQKFSTWSAFFIYGRIPVLLGVAWLITSCPVMAENIEGRFSVSPFAGGQGFPFGGQTHYDGDFDWGVRLGYNISAHVRTELIFGQNKTVHDPEVAFCTINQYGADLLYLFNPEKKFVPLVAAGFGAFEEKFYGDFDGPPPHPGPLPDETNPYFNYGAGVEYALNRWFALRADFRHAIMLNSGDHSFQGVIGFRFQF